LLLAVVAGGVLETLAVAVAVLAVRWSIQTKQLIPAHTQ
jgi:hypothetical protein